MSLLSFTYFIGGMMLTLALVGLVITAVLPVLDHWNKRFFMILFSLLALTLVALITDLIVFSYPNLAPAEKTAVFFECLFISLLSVMPTAYLLHCDGKKTRNSLLFTIVLMTWIVFFILLLIAQFSKFFYYITPDNRFFRGQLFSLLLLPLVVIDVMNLTALIRRRKVLSGKMFISLLVYLIPMTVGIIVHMFIDFFQIVDLGILLSTITMFSLVVSEQIEQYRLQQKEIVRQQANIMVLQMRPHFIYNSLTSIYYLCDQDPKKAQQVINDFTTYLRKNFTAVSKEDTIPFPEELAHTKAYLAVEKALHEDLLFIDYDTPHTRFRIPPLTLQPIVENAIKHGLDPDAEPLCISIRTRKTDSGAEIIVTDNGIGFEPEAETEPNSALSNIQQRLEMMCGGSITITPREEGGTLVTVIIPE